MFRLSPFCWLFVTSLFFSTTALACPKVLDLIDPDCNGRIRIGFTGDSIVKGVGAAPGKSYPDQIAKIINDDRFRIFNIGVAGATADTLHRGFIRHIDEGGETTRNTRRLDYLMIQVGTNAYWRWKFNNLSAAHEVMKIVRLRKYLQRALRKRHGFTPIVFTALIPFTDRSFQNPFIAEINEELRRAAKIVNLIGPDFSSIPTPKLHLDDQLHPNDMGYRVMAKKVKKNLYGGVQKYAKNFVKDRDKDGIYDEAEGIRFFTNPKKADTDDDGLNDGEEVFTYLTNPNTSDSDFDGFSDKEEIDAGTNPLDQEDFPVEEQS